MQTVKPEHVGMPDVYCHPSVKKVVALHAELLSIYPGNLRVIGVLEHQSRVLLKGFTEGDVAVCIQLSNWLPECAGMSSDQLLKQDLTIHHMRLAVSREHGYESWSQVLADGVHKLDAHFEAAVDAVLSGNLKKLNVLLATHPGLINQTSQYGHRATLLIYLAANGVETWRQVVPTNAAQVLTFLIEAGADMKKCINVYGGQHNALELLLSSAHPRAAGVLDEMIQVWDEISAGE
ncbi:MAG: hypothetical protein AB8G77_23645 [Rhodothermales bacterium]